MNYVVLHIGHDLQLGRTIGPIGSWDEALGAAKELAEEHGKESWTQADEERLQESGTVLLSCGSVIHVGGLESND